MSFEHLARILGGAVGWTDGQVWLATTIGGLPAAVVPRRRGRAAELTYDLVVFTRPDPAFDLRRHDWVVGWVADGKARYIPRLRHGYMFAGYRRGALLAITLEPPSVEHVVNALWDLAAWARQPWTLAADDQERPVHPRHERRRPWLERFARAADVAIIVVALVALRRTL